MADNQLCPKCGRRGKIIVQNIYGHKYYYFQHYGFEKPKRHYLGKEKPKSNGDKERPSNLLLEVLRLLKRLSSKGGAIN